MIKRGREREWAQTSTALAKQNNQKKKKTREEGREGGGESQVQNWWLTMRWASSQNEFVGLLSVTKDLIEAGASCPLSVALFGMLSML